MSIVQHNQYTRLGSRNRNKHFGRLTYNVLPLKKQFENSLHTQVYQMYEV